MLSSTTNIKIAIKYLHWIQDNIEEIQALPDCGSESLDVDLDSRFYEFSPYFGLCDNALCGELADCDIETMFLAWPECVSKMYPCGDRIDFLNYANLYCNPKRLELIKHCIKHMQTELEKRDAQED